MILKKLFQSFAQPPKFAPLSAYKYLRSISETALLYKPLKTRSLVT